MMSAIVTRSGFGGSTASHCRCRPSAACNALSVIPASTVTVMSSAVCSSTRFNEFNCTPVIFSRLAFARASASVNSVGLRGCSSMSEVVLCGDLLARRKIRAALRAREHLVRITATLGIEHAPQRAHRVQIDPGKLLLHEIDLFHTDAMLARCTAAHRDALLEDVMTGGQRPAHLVRFTFIVKDQWMDVAVAGVEHVRDAQAVLLAARADEAHHLRQFRARHHSVLRQKIRTQPPDGPERALAAFPQVHA